MSDFFIGRLVGELVLDTSKWVSGMTTGMGQLSQAEAQIDKFGQKASRAGTALTVGVTAPILGIGAAAITSGASFERVMNQFEGVTNATAEDMAIVRDAAIEWGQKTQFSATESAEAMLELSKAGLDTRQSIAALPPTLQLATAAGMGMKEAATLAANTMATFKLKAEEMAGANDILVASANSSTIDVGHLAQSLKFAGTLADVANVSLSETASALATLGGAGLKAEMAGTGFRGMLSSLLSPTKATKFALSELGFATEVEAGKTVRWTDMLNALHEKLGQGQDVVDEYTGLIMGGFGQRAGPAVLAMAKEGGDAILEFSRTLEGSTGAAARMSEATMKGVPGAIEIMKGSLETASASLLTAFGPALVSVTGLISQAAEFVTGTLVPAFTALPAPMQNGILLLGAFVVAAGPVLMVVGGMASGIAALIPVVVAVGGAFAALTESVALVWIGIESGMGVLASLTTVFGTTLLTLTGVGAAVVALGTIWYVWGDDIKRIVTETYVAVKTWLWDKLEPVLTPIGGLLTSVGAMFTAFKDLVWAIGVKVVEIHMEMVVGIGMWLHERLRPIIDPAIALFRSIATVVGTMKDQVVAHVTAFYTNVKTWLLDRFTGIVDGLKGKIDAVTGFFRNMYDAVVGHSYVPDMVSGIASEFGKLGNVAMVNPAKSATDDTSGFFSSMASTVSGIVGGIAGSMSTAFSDWLTGTSSFGEAFGGIWSGIKDSFSGILSSMLDNFVNGFIGSALNALAGSSNAFTSILGSIFGGKPGGGFLGGLLGGGAGGASGVPSIGAYGASSGYGSAGLMAGVGVGSVAAGAAGAIALGAMSTEFIRAAFGDHYISPGAEYEMQLGQAQQGADYMGISLDDYFARGLGDWMNQMPSYRGGTGGYVDFHEGTPVMLHGREKVTPEGSEVPQVVYSPTYNQTIDAVMKSPRELMSDLLDLLRKNDSGCLGDLQRLVKV